MDVNKIQPNVSPANNPGQEPENSDQNELTSEDMEAVSGGMLSPGQQNDVNPQTSAQVYKGWDIKINKQV